MDKPSWLRSVLAAVPALALIALAIAFFVLTRKTLQVGGLVGKLFGDEPAPEAIGIANSIPPERVDEVGRLIPIGTPDAHGFTQAEVVEVDRPHILSNPNTVSFRPIGEDMQEVQLPVGVKQSDVEHVVVVRPGHFVVSVSDRTGVKAEDIDALLGKLTSSSR